MKESRNYILWLPSWYPCRLTPYDGDFIQRHAKAVSLYTPVHVLHIVRDRIGTVTNDVLIEEKEENDLKETIIYYYSTRFLFKPLESYLSFLKFNSIYKKYLQDLFKEMGHPSLVHVHISFKAGLVAKWIKEKKGIPYLLTEHWTIYLPEAKPSLKDLNLASRNHITEIINDAELILPVSDYLGKVIQKRWPSSRYEVVPNVVNEKIFHLTDHQPGPTLKLVHISTLTYQKDPESLLAAAALLKKRGVEFTLDIIGPETEDIKKLIHFHGIEEKVKCRGEMPQHQLADYIRNSDALILYSRYETFGCVLIEANACGVPVIVPDTELMHELVQEKINGLLVSPDSVESLADTLEMYNHIKSSFDRKLIAQRTIKNFSYERVGKMYSDIYSRYM